MKDAAASKDEKVPNPTVSSSAQSYRIQVSASAAAVLASLKVLGSTLKTLSDASLKDSMRIDAGARQIMLSLGRIYCG